MTFFIGLLLPSLIGYKVFMIVNKKRKLNIESKVFYYLMFVLFSNMTSVILSSIFFNLNTNLEASLEASPLFSIKYIIISIISNIVLVVIFSFIKEVSFSIDIKKKDKVKYEKNHK